MRIALYCGALLALGCSTPGLADPASPVALDTELVESLGIHAYLTLKDHGVVVSETPPFTVPRRDHARSTEILKRDLAQRQGVILRALSEARALIGPGKDADPRNRQALGLLWNAAWVAGRITPELEALIRMARSHCSDDCIRVASGEVTYLDIDEADHRVFIGEGNPNRYNSDRSEDVRLIVWNLETNSIDRVLGSEDAPNHPLARSGPLVITFGNGIYRLLDWKAERVLWTYPFNASGREIAYVQASASFSGDGKRFAIATVDKGCRVFETESQKDVFSYASRDWISAVRLSDSGEHLLVGLAAGPSYSVLVDSKGAEMGTGRFLRHADFDPPGRYVALGGYQVHVLHVQEGWPEILSLGRGVQGIVETRGPEAVRAVRFSPDGFWLASLDESGRRPWDLGEHGRPAILRIWDVHSGTLHASFEVGSTAGSLCWSGDSKSVWIGLGDGRIRKLHLDWNGEMSRRTSVPVVSKTPMSLLPSKEEEFALEKARGDAPSLPKAEQEALKALTGTVTRKPRWTPQPRLNLAWDIQELCPEAVDLLRGSSASVDGPLIDLALSTESLSARYLAVRILGLRSNALAVPMLLRMLGSHDEDERFLALNNMRACAADKTLDFSAVGEKLVSAFESEGDPDLREWFAWLFGEIECRAAIPALRVALRVQPAFNEAVWALGVMKAVEAVPEIIASFLKSKRNEHYPIQALGLIGGDEAVQFLLLHLSDYLAPEALAETRDPRALPALEEHLRERRYDSDINYSATRIAILRLRHANPARVLLETYEDPKEDPKVRHNALWTLTGYDTREFQPRILKIYRQTSDTDIRGFCIWMLKESTVPDVTQAMIAHARSFDDQGRSGMATAHYLLEALNYRLKTKFKDLRSVVEYYDSPK